MFTNIIRTSLWNTKILACKTPGKAEKIMELNSVQIIHYVFWVIKFYSSLMMMKNGLQSYDYTKVGAITTLKNIVDVVWWKSGFNSLQRLHCDDCWWQLAMTISGGRQYLLMVINFKHFSLDLSSLLVFPSWRERILFIDF